MLEREIFVMSQGKVSFTFKKKVEPKKLLVQDVEEKPQEPEIVTSIEGGLIASNSKKTNELVIPLRSGKSVGEVPTMKDYERVPVEDFGLAMLKGMGWMGNDKPS